MDRLTQIGMKAAAISEWLDSYGPNAARSPEARLWARTVGKITEENGEVAEALIGYTGQNPRKGETHKMEAVLNELADVWIAATGAIEHILGNTGTSVDFLMERVEFVYDRAGLGPVPLADAA